MPFFGPYVSVAQRKQRALRKMAQLAKKGHPVTPVQPAGRIIAKSTWGAAWCDNLEAYSDYENRLPRGRRLIRNGSVVDLQISPRSVEAWVAGSTPYRVTITIAPLCKDRWADIRGTCAGGIESMLSLLHGRFDSGLMDRLCRQGDGLFPSPADISFDCTCPDWSSMCKHVSAALYGVGTRLDAEPELLFTLRDVDPAELIATGKAIDTTAALPDDQVIAGDDIADIFGLDLDDSPNGLDERAPAAAPSAGGKAKTKGAKKPQPAGRKKKQRKVAANTAPKVTPAGKNTSKASTRAKVSKPAAAAKPARTTGGSPARRDPASRLLTLLNKRGQLTSAEAQKSLRRSAADLRPLFKQLLAEGHATSTGRTRGTVYHAVR